MKRILLVLAIAPLLAQVPAKENLVWENKGPSVQEYNSALQQAVGLHSWWAVVDYASLINEQFPTSPFAQEAPYLMGEAYYKLDQLEFANECLTEYLSRVTSPKHFEEAIEYKFSIAEQFAHGAKKRLFGSTKMPAWVPAQEDAIPIYDEVIAAVPHSELGIKALLGKARVQAECEDYKPAVETLDLLIRRFPRHELAAEAFLEKEKVYLAQCRALDLDPDILDMAEVSLRKFRLAFPREPRLEEATKLYADMQEIFAQNLLETGRFFEKTKKLEAALIYYNKVVRKYPNTEAAVLSREKLDTFQPDRAH
jgi:outer membrane protein assembly factor BamD (BamD/ComL family)